MGFASVDFISSRNKSSTPNIKTTLLIEDKNEYLFLFILPVKIIKNSKISEINEKYNKLNSIWKKSIFLFQ